jgi:OPA family glycerol-3-phosphate transporter-like MFS transporter
MQGWISNPPLHFDVQGDYMDIPQEFRQPDYRLRRFQNWMIIGLLYSFFYMTRYNFTALAPVLKEIFGWTKSDFGIFETMLPLVYGLSVVINGPIADRIGGKKAFLIGSVGVVIMNFLMGFSHIFLSAPAVWDKNEILKPAELSHGISSGMMILMLVTIWSVNGYFQSFGALSIVKINAQWFHIRERGTFSAIFGVLIRFGLILAFSGAPFIASILPWYWAFWLPAIVVAVLFFLTLFLVEDTPGQAGYGELDTGEESAGFEITVRITDILKKIFTSKVMWMIAVASMMIGIVRRSVVDAWYPLYFSEFHHVSGTGFEYQLAAWGIAIAGIIGGFVFGIMSDRVYGGRRAPVVTIGFIGMVLSLLLFILSDFMSLGAISAAACLIILSSFVNGSHGMIGGAASMDFGGRKAAATAAGLFDGMQYLAASFVGKVVGYLSTIPDGWQWWKAWPIPFAIAGAIIMATLWNVMPKKHSGH